MKKLFCVVALAVVIGGGAAVAQPHSLDLVMLVDTSASMFPYWHDTTDYLVRNVLTNVLKKGDSFHLISFASRPDVEISQKIESEGDVRAILARYLLLQPLGRFTDLVAAIQYLYRYVIALPQSTQKEIIILTDGIDDPPPGSSFPITGANGTNVARVRRVIVETAHEMRRQGWTVHIIQYPIAGTQVAGPPQPGVQLLGGLEAQAAPAKPGEEAGKAVGGAAASAGERAAGTASAASPGLAERGGAAPAARGAAGEPGAAGAVPGGAASAARPGLAERGGAAPAAKEAAGESGAAGAVPGGAAGAAPAPSPSGAASSAVAAAPTGAGAGTTAGTGREATAGPQGPAAAGHAAGKSGAAHEGKAPLLSALSQALGVPIQQYEGVKKKELANVATGAPEVLFPKNLGRIGYRASVPFTIRNFQDRSIRIRLTGVIYDGSNLLRRPVNLSVGAKSESTLRAALAFPSSLSAGPHSIKVDLQFSDSLRESPHTGTLAFTLRTAKVGRPASSAYYLPILIGIVLIVVIVLIVLLVRRIVANLRSSPSVSAAPPLRFDAAGGAIQPIELRVSGQNPNIGARNIHPIGTGGRRAVGGGASPFLIYLYPCPPRIAEIVREGENYTLVPLRPEFFPGLSGEYPDCLGKEILVQAHEGRRVTIVFRRYVSPLDEVNRIMHLVDAPGTPGEGVT